MRAKDSCGAFGGDNVANGNELSLSNKQAIIRSDYAEEAYQKKLSDSVKSLLPRATEPLAISIGDTTPAVESEWAITN